MSKVYGDLYRATDNIIVALGRQIALNAQMRAALEAVVADSSRYGEPTNAELLASAALEAARAK